MTDSESRERRGTAASADPASRPRREEQSPPAAKQEDPDVYRTIFERTFQFTGLLAADGTLLEANRTALEFAGVARESVVGRPFWETPWWPPRGGVRERLREAVRRAGRGQFVRYEAEVEGRGGRLAIIDFSLTPVQDEAGTVTTIIPEGRDITDRKRVEEALRRSEAKFEGILRGAPDAVISIDDSHRIELFNEGAERIFGYRREEVLGQPLDLLIPERFRREHRRHVQEFGSSPVLARGMGERGETAGLRKNGEEFPAEASIARVDVGGSRIYTVVLRDITERREAESDRARLLAEARAATRARDEMLRVVAHDLQNPVTGILMGIKLLRMRSRPEEREVAELVEGMELAATRLNRLIRDLRDVAHIDAGRLSVDLRPLSVARLLDETARTFAPLAEERSVALTWAVDEEAPPVRADRDRALQVLGNLLDNALKWTPAGGSIAILAAGRGDEVEVTVSDTGPGIPEEELPHVFERFWRGSIASKAGLGAGLGLAIARGIVEGHGGRMWAKNRSGGGATFGFTLRAAAARAARPER